jgi:hypothetical protein
MMSFKKNLLQFLKTAHWVRAQFRLHKLTRAIILQAYLGIYDDEVIEEMLMDQRWQLVLDFLKCEIPPFKSIRFS